VNVGISFALRLGLEERLSVAAVRTVVQLLLIGLVLEWVFRHASWWLVLAMLTAMTVIAGVAAVRRTTRRYPGIWMDSVLSVWSSSWLVSAVALLAIVPVEPWWRPQYAIPLAGMIMGNALNGISLGLERLGEALSAGRGEVETLLALGATRWEAARGPIQNAVRTGMIPTINSMVVVGIVSLPGMMTGQLLAGISPLEAVKYQIAIMFLIAASTALGTVGVVLLGYLRLFNKSHQFLYWRLRRSGR
jgi:putative ABC transport system permease protein